MLMSPMGHRPKKGCIGDAHKKLNATDPGLNTLFSNRYMFRSYDHLQAEISA
jgi:hypothetical protein